MIGANTLATPPFWLHKQAVRSLFLGGRVLEFELRTLHLQDRVLYPLSPHLIFQSASRHPPELAPGVATLGPIKGISQVLFSCLLLIISRERR
jgi:hypothetical protein